MTAQHWRCATCRVLHFIAAPESDTPACDDCGHPLAELTADDFLERMGDAPEADAA